MTDPTELFRIGATSINETRAAFGLGPIPGGEAGQPPPPVHTWRVVYTNWRGETAIRNLRPLSIRFGSSQWHPEPQWLVRAEDVDRGFEVHEYALRDMVPA
jgi:hypothetical protein